MPDLELVLYHEPIPWKRPGQAINRHVSGRIRYDTQRGIKDALGCILLSQMTKHSPFTNTVHLEAEFVFPKPKSYPRYFYGLQHNKKPDIDNILKFYLDLCKDYGVFVDDALVARVVAEKRYVFADENPHVYLKFFEKGV